ncbi:MAG: polymer-forming cytoskeletal protein, partial [Rubrobacteraceae bacterium]
LLLFFHPNSAEALQSKAFGSVTVETGEVAEGGVSTSVGDIEVLGSVEGDVEAASGNVSIRGPVDGDVSVMAGNVEVEAPVDGEIEAGFGNVYINSEVDGDVTVERGNVELGPETRISGSINHGSGSFVAAPGAEFDGTRAGMASDFDDESEGSDLLGFIGWTLSTALFAAVCVLAAVLIPRPLTASSRQVGEKPLWSMAAGVGSVVAAMVLFVVLLISGIGIPILILLAPLYLGFVFFGAVVVAYFIGRKVVMATGRYRSGNTLAAVIGAVILAAVHFLPLGFLLLCLISLFGAGAAIMAIFSGRRPRTYARAEYNRARDQRP